MIRKYISAYIVLNRKISYCTVAVLLLLTAIIPIVSAQERVFDYKRAYNDYVYSYGVYRQSLADYVSSKEAYLNYKTLTSKNDAQVKTLNMLRNRDETIRTYIAAIRLKLSETTGISNYDQNILYLKLDSEIAWYLKHREDLNSAGSLEDLVTSSSKTEEKYKETEVLIYQTLGTIASGKETMLRDRLSGQLEKLKNKMSDVRARGDKKTTILERWLLESENRLTRSQEKQLQAQQLLSNMKSYQTDKNQVYNQALYQFEQSNQYLKESVNNIKEFIREIKHAD